jgi:DNA repair exonuclease SbcCD nuclease subunit
MSVPDLKVELEAARERLDTDRTNLLIAHVALTSLPARAYRDINELEVEESAFDRRFDLVVLGHYHGHQKVSRRTWYAGSTDTFWYSDAPETAKGLVVVDTEAGTVEHVPNPNERPLTTASLAAASLSAGELVDAVEAAGKGMPDRAIVRIYLNEVDPAAYRQVANEQFQEAVPQALWVQVEADFGGAALAVQGGPTIGSLEQEWAAYLELQDLAGLDRERVVGIGTRLLQEAKGETV